MADIIKLKKGLDIPLKGKIKDFNGRDVNPAKVGIVPDDYPGYGWKAVVKAGQAVAKGDALLIAKERENIMLVSPAAGIVEEIRRGERRKIEAVVVKCASGASSRTFSGNAESPDDIKSLLCKSGLWAMMRQRPYDIVPDPEVTPRDIFVTAFDSAPLAIPMLQTSQFKAFEAGIQVLGKLTSGKVYLGVAFGSGLTVRGAEVYEFQGPHPAGNAGIQAAAIKPVNKGETIWTLDARTVVRIGCLIAYGELDMTTEVAVTGTGITSPGIINTQIGADMASVMRGFEYAGTDCKRIISGNVLTGVAVNPEDGFLRYPYRQVTVIPEGDHADEFMGWASMSPKKYSVKRSFPAFLRGQRATYNFDSRLLGGRRAMILSGEYDKVIPMDIYPEYLLKAIMARDIERMERLGIYEVAPEDFALAEFVDTSKQPIQQIVREGLDYLRKEM